MERNLLKGEIFCVAKDTFFFITTVPVGLERECLRADPQYEIKKMNFFLLGLFLFHSQYVPHIFSFTYIYVTCYHLPCFIHELYAVIPSSSHRPPHSESVCENLFSNIFSVL